jgi:hypothetical protein
MVLGFRFMSAAAAAACLSLSSLALSETLTGAILDEGTEAIVEDFVQLPASASSSPLARVNAIKEAPDGTGRLFANDMRGTLYVIVDGVASSYMHLPDHVSNFRSSPGRIPGFTSFAFHPEFAINGRFYTVHSEDVGSTPANLGPAIPVQIDLDSIVSEWIATDPSSNSWSGSSRELIRVAAPHHFHNLGEVAFNPTAAPADDDYGLLYICGGDYGSVFEGKEGQLQRLDTPLGTVMRIDPLGGPFLRDGIVFGYGIPESNPFADDPDPDVLGEIYAYGARNAHRIAWDRGGSDSGPFVSDIGEKNIEEVNRLVPGANYGWPVREGTFEIDTDRDPTRVFPLPDDDSGYTYPVAQYDHEEGRAIAGGFVYRGDAASSLNGKFVLGDMVSGRILYADAQEMLDADDADAATTARLYELNLVRDGEPATLLEIVADALGKTSVSRTDLRFGTDEAGQIYITTKEDGFIRKLTPVPEPGARLGLLAATITLAGLASARARAPRS